MAAIGRQGKTDCSQTFPSLDTLLHNGTSQAFASESWISKFCVCAGASARTHTHARKHTQARPHTRTHAPQQTHTNRLLCRNTATVLAYICSAGSQACSCYSHLHPDQGSGSAKISNSTQLRTRLVPLPPPGFAGRWRWGRRHCSSAGAAWGRRGSSVRAAYERRAAVCGQRGSCVEAMWGQREDGIGVEQGWA